MMRDDMPDLWVRTCVPNTPLTLSTSTWLTGSYAPPEFTDIVVRSHLYVSQESQNPNAYDFDFAVEDGSANKLILVKRQSGSTGECGCHSVDGDVEAT
jgi:hypothetical protein